MASMNSIDLTTCVMEVKVKSAIQMKFRHDYLEALEEQCPGRFLGIISQDPSVSKSNRLQIEIFLVFFLDLSMFSKFF